ncbi:reverse transcriptase domain-containing protein [Tanacetum coccineum]
MDEKERRSGDQAGSDRGSQGGGGVLVNWPREKGEPRSDRNARNDNKRSRTGRAFAIITNSVRKEYTGVAPKCTNCNYHHQLEVPCRLCTNCNRFGHISKDCRVGPRIVNVSEVIGVNVSPEC